LIGRRSLTSGALAFAASAATAQAAEPSWIDSHAHAFVRGVKLAADARYAPGYDASWEILLAIAHANGVGRIVLLQPSFLGFDNGYLFGALRTRPGRFRGVPWIAPAAGRFISTSRAPACQKSCRACWRAAPPS
jgi:predicted TIM-barrel fold metal-dependent hydrolase